MDSLRDEGRVWKPKWVVGSVAEGGGFADGVGGVC